MPGPSARGPKTRVGVFWPLPPKSRPKNASQVAGFASGCTVCGYEIRIGCALLRPEILLPGDGGQFGRGQVVPFTSATPPTDDAGARPCPTKLPPFTPKKLYAASAPSYALCEELRRARSAFTWVQFSLTPKCDIKLSWSLPAAAASGVGDPGHPIASSRLALPAFALRATARQGRAAHQRGARSQPRSGFAFARNRPAWWRAFFHRLQDVAVLVAAGVRPGMDRAVRLAAPCGTHDLSPSACECLRRASSGASPGPRRIHGKGDPRPRLRAQSCSERVMSHLLPQKQLRPTPAARAPRRRRSHFPIADCANSCAMPVLRCRDRTQGASNADAQSSTVKPTLMVTCQRSTLPFEITPRVSTT